MSGFGDHCPIPPRTVLMGERRERGVGKGVAAGPAPWVAEGWVGVGPGVSVEQQTKQRTVKRRGSVLNNTIRIPLIAICILVTISE